MHYIVWLCEVNADLDKQGRFIVNKNLREFAEIERDVMIIGVSDRIVIIYNIKCTLF